MISLTEAFLRKKPVVEYPGQKSNDRMIEGEVLLDLLKHAKKSPEKGLRATLAKRSQNGTAKANGGRG